MRCTSGRCVRCPGLETSSPQEPISLVPTTKVYLLDSLQGTCSVTRILAISETQSIVSTLIIYSLYSSSPNAIYQSQAMLSRNITNILLLSGYLGNRCRKSTEGSIRMQKGEKVLLTLCSQPSRNQIWGEKGRDGVGFSRVLLVVQRTLFEDTLAQIPVLAGERYLHSYYGDFSVLWFLR